MDYKGLQKAKVEIICTLEGHGSFSQLPSNHLRYEGCPPCSGRGPGDTDLFIAKARAKHGDKYDYSSVRYVNSSTEITVRCARCGHTFPQIPSNHLASRAGGCNPCARGAMGTYQVPTTEEWIARARGTHGDRFDYARSEYAGADVEITIRCVRHDFVFDQLPGVHVKGHSGCRPCYAEAQRANFSLSREEFIQRAQGVHGDLYDYSEVQYVNAHTPVQIICPKPRHGDYPKTPHSHVDARSGCPKCSREERTAALIMRFPDFLRQARELHGDRYSYAAAGFVDAGTDIRIICREPGHPPFTMSPSVHLRGQGCSRTHQSRGEAAVEQFLTDAGVEYHYQWRQHDCADKRSLPFDFALPDLRILIEFDGVQHREPVRWALSISPEVAEERLAAVQRRDRLKDAWAERNGWTLVRISEVKDVSATLRALLPH